MFLGGGGGGGGRYDLGGNQAIDGQERGEVFIGNRGRQGTCLPQRLLVQRVLKMC
jgi:hypothetical protein